MRSAAPTRRPPALKQFAAMWTLVGQPDPAREWSMEEKFREARRAGFDGVGWGPMPEALPLCEKFGLEYVCYIGGDAQTFADQLEAAHTTRPARVNVQFYRHETPPREAVRVWIKMKKLADKMGLAIDLEVHRDTCTETPEKAYEMAALYRKATGQDIRFCWDFSHLAVVKHLVPPYADRLLTQPKLIQRARQVHFRPFNGHHAQVPATDGRGNPSLELASYLEFVEAFFACWLRGARGGEVLYACPENGPVSSGYGLTCFPNVWEDAIYLRKQIGRLWTKQLRVWNR